MKKLKLLSFKPVGEKWTFEILVVNTGEIQLVTLREKYWWPVLIGTRLDLVERWLMQSYYKELLWMIN